MPMFNPLFFSFRKSSAAGAAGPFASAGAVGEGNATVARHVGMWQTGNNIKKPNKGIDAPKKVEELIARGKTGAGWD